MLPIKMYCLTDFYSHLYPSINFCCPKDVLVHSRTGFEHTQPFWSLILDLQSVGHGLTRGLKTCIEWQASVLDTCVLTV